jgi:broad specificity phosphatase PhoE
LLLIRHARAGHRSDWPGDDRRRPLDQDGRAQALALVHELADSPITRIVSSPYDRCVQTVEPLAAEHGLPIEVREELSEEEQLTSGMELVRSLVAEPVAVCVHGGLSDVAFGQRLKKGGILLVDRDGSVVERRRV